ncbi:MAG: sensor histidine kinase [Vulcanimicrobiaceae bacterium]
MASRPSDVRWFDRFRIVPKGWGLGALPYVNLLYLGFLFIDPVVSHSNARAWLLTLGAIGAFLPLYVLGYRGKNWVGYLVVAGMLALGIAAESFNVGAAAFLIYGAATLAFLDPPSIAWPRLCLYLLITAVGLRLERVPLAELGSWLLIAGAVGALCVESRRMQAMNCELRLAREEVERLAKVAERERIARDLHDVLGHTLSVIALKSELAARLAECDPARAAGEVREVERIARTSLGELREAIVGYRAPSLADEIVRAREVLAAANVSLVCDAMPLDLTSTQEGVLSLALREAVTNVVRHAGARVCRLSIERVGANCRLEVRDDGRGGNAPEGSGLAGMRERVEALGGTLVRDGTLGTRLVLSFPLAT